MYKICFLCVLLTLLNCNQEPSKKKQAPKTNVKPDIKTTVKIDTAAATQKKEFTKLNSKNALDFFLEYGKHNKENKVRISTDFGAIDILLFKNTRYHRANFIFLTKQKYFKDTQFYRVIDNFVVQAGNSDDKKTMTKRFDIGEYLLPTDMNKGYKHHRGVISMPSSEIENPYKLASPYEFFIVQRKGGAHGLNGNYTIFGKVIKGMDVVDKIAAVKTDETDWPLRNIFIRDVKIID